MKTSLKKLQKLAAIKHDRRSRKKQNPNHQHLAEDELARATQAGWMGLSSLTGQLSDADCRASHEDMNDMKDCYERLLSAAAAAANSVYELSESLREMGDCLLEKTALNDDEESGKVLLMLGKVQFELQKLVDGYRSHIFQTITIPSESLLNELHIVEEMKKSCDEKRAMYEDLMKKQRDKGRLRSSKGEYFHSPQLQEAQDEYDEEANLFVFRTKSLKQGQSRSFLTQASRHHAAQLYFFKKAVRSLEAVEPHVRSLAEQLHIDYQFSEIKHDGFCDDDDDDESDGDDDTEDGSETLDYRELSFDYRRTSPMREVHTSKKMEMDKSDPMVSPYSKVDFSEVINFGRKSISLQIGAKEVSKSAPLFPEKKFDTAKQTGHLRPLSSRKFTSYVLPTPDEAKSPASAKLSRGVFRSRQSVPNLWHSSPLNQNRYEKPQAEGKLSGPIILDAQSVLKESNTTRSNSPPSQSVEGHSLEQLDPNLASYAKKARRQAFSGPLTRKPLPNALNFTASGPIISSAFPLHFSGSILHTPVPQPSSSPKVSSGVSPKTTSAPRISELHELPRPPPHLAIRRPANHITHSGPIISKSRMPSTSVPEFTAASALPTPPQALSRSYSISAGGSSEVAQRSSLGSSHDSRMEKDVLSPPLSLITLPKCPGSIPCIIDG